MAAGLTANLVFMGSIPIFLTVEFESVTQQ